MAIFGKFFGKGKSEEAGPRQQSGQNVIDRSVLRKQNLTGGLIPIFQEDLLACMEHIRQGITSKDAKRATQGSNGLRSIGTTIGSTPLRNAAESMTKAAETGDWTKATADREPLIGLVTMCVDELSDMAKEFGV